MTATDQVWQAWTAEPYDQKAMGDAVARLRAESHGGPIAQNPGINCHCDDCGWDWQDSRSTDNALAYCPQCASLAVVETPADSLRTSNSALLTAALRALRAITLGNGREINWDAIADELRAAIAAAKEAQ